MIRLGTDIVYIPRIRKAYERFGDRFLNRVYTQTEQRNCGFGKLEISGATNVQSQHPSIVSLAGRWAAKEAVVKAIGTGWLGIGYTDVEICRYASGAPFVALHNRAVEAMNTWKEADKQNHLDPFSYQWQLSFSHDGDYAIATAILIYCL
ncbi:MAG: holo-ACP synthase [Cyanobacteria bacterium P01_A01_bin.84]